MGTEIASMNGAVVMLGRQYGIATPANEVLTAMIQHRESVFAMFR